MTVVERRQKLAASAGCERKAENDMRVGTINCVFATIDGTSVTLDRFSLYVRDRRRMMCELLPSKVAHYH